MNGVISYRVSPSGYQHQQAFITCEHHGPRAALSRLPMGAIISKKPVDYISLGLHVVHERLGQNLGDMIAQMRLFKA